MERFDIFDFLEKTKKSGSKRLTKNELTTLEHNIVKSFKEYGVGENSNTITVKWLMENHPQITSDSQWRKLWKNIKTKKVDNYIYGNKKVGKTWYYFIMTRKDNIDPQANATNHALSSMESVLKQQPEKAALFFKKIWETIRDTDAVPHLQQQMKLTGYERGEVHRFADKYLNDKNDND
jgi:hypothetical protein